MSAGLVTRVPAALAERYPPRRVLGEGAFGLVLAAEDLARGGEVALKIFKGTEGEARDRFLREARLAARVRHPNVVGVRDHGEVEGVLYLVSELVLGGDLSARLEANPGGLGEAMVARLARELLAGLGAIHGAGIVHRDLKPANVLLGPDGTASITDFGMGRGGGEATMTATGSILGTPIYMAPEQFRGLEPTPATDLYALGLLLYEAAAGQRPHPVTGGMGAVMGARLAGAHDSLEALGVTAPGLVTLVDALLEPTPGDRPASAEAALELLQGESAAPGPEPAAPRKVSSSGAFQAEREEKSRPGRRPFLLWGAVVACVAVGFLAWSPGEGAGPGGPPPAPPEVPRFVADQEALQRLRLRVRGDDGIRDGTGLTAETATEDAVSAWTRARRRFRRVVGEAQLGARLRGLAEAPFDHDTHEDAVELVRFEALLGPSLLKGVPRLWPEGEEPGLAAFLARTVRVDPIPALQPWPPPNQDRVSWELDGIGRSFGGAWVQIRRQEDLRVLPGKDGRPWYDERVKYQNLDGVVFANPIAKLRPELQILVRDVDKVDRAEAPPEVRIPLRALGGGDLEVALVLRDFLSVQAIQVEVIGSDRRLSWVGRLDPPEGADPASGYRAPVRLRVAAARLPEGAGELRIVGLGIQAVRHPNDYFRVGNGYQRIGQ